MEKTHALVTVAKQYSEGLITLGEFLCHVAINAPICSTSPRERNAIEAISKIAVEVITEEQQNHY